MEEVSIIKAFSKFKPESCVFVISVDKNSKPNGMVASWYMRCSHNPPLFAISLKKIGNTHKLIRESKEFVIAVPNKGLEKEVVFFGSKSGKNIDKFKETKIKTVKARYIKSPLIKDAIINFECKLRKEIDSGDHIIFIGEILNSYLNKGKILFNLGRKEGKRVFGEL